MILCGKCNTEKQKLGRSRSQVITTIPTNGIGNTVENPAKGICFVHLTAIINIWQFFKIRCIVVGIAGGSFAVQMDTVRHVVRPREERGT